MRLFKASRCFASLFLLCLGWALPSWAYVTVSPNPSTNGTYTVSWTDTANTSCGQANAYVVYEESPSGDQSTNALWNPADRQIVKTGKTNGTYRYWVRVADGCRSSNGGTHERYRTTPKVSVTVNITPPSSRPNLSTVSANTSGSYSVSWTSTSNTDTYRLQQRVGSGSWTNVQNTSARSKSFSGKSSNVYSYRVASCNAGGCGNYSSVRNVAVARPPGVPSSLNAPGGTRNTSSLSLSWTTPSGSVSHYELDQRKNSGNYSRKYTGSSRNYTASGLNDGTYTYRVRACKVVSNAEGCSGWRTSTSTIIRIPPSTPANVSIPGTIIQPYSVNWGSVSGAVSYKLQTSSNSSGGWTNVSGYNGVNHTFHVAVPTLGSRYFRVAACGSNGACSGWKVSNLGVGRSSGAYHGLAQPSMPSTDTDGAFTMTWGNMALATHFRVQKFSGTSWSTIEDNTRSQSYSVNNVGSGLHTYRIQGCNYFGCTNSPGNTIAVARAPGIPPSISVPEHGVIDSDIAVSWTRSSGTVSAYYLQSNSGGTWTHQASGSSRARTTQSSHAGPVQHRVRACRTVGAAHACSSWRTSSSTIIYGAEGSDPIAGSPYQLRAPTLADSRGFQVTWQPHPSYPNAEYLLIETEYVNGSGSGRHRVAPFDTSQPSYDRQFPPVGNEYTFSVCAINPATQRCYTVDGQDDYMEPLGYRVKVIDSSLPTVNNPANAIGSTPYETDVDFKGNASLSIPIKLPPGRNGLQPALSINYNSGGAQQRNTRWQTQSLWQGGWSLGGFSEIYRCTLGREDHGFTQLAPNPGVTFPYAQWQFPELRHGVLPLRARPLVDYGFPNTNDRLCIDDKLLILIHGTHLRPGAVYRMEDDAYKRISIKEAPGYENHTPQTREIYFEVEQPDGRLSTYGMGRDARVRVEDDPDNEYFKWAIDNVIDGFDNQITISYQKLSHKIYGDTIFGEDPALPPFESKYVSILDQNGVPIPNLFFTYEAGVTHRGNNEKELRFIPKNIQYPGGSVDFYNMTSAPRIEVSASVSEAPRIYDISYGSRISSIQECQGGSCLPALEFEYHNATSEFQGKLRSVEDGVGSQTIFNYMIMSFNCEGFYDRPMPPSNPVLPPEWIYFDELDYKPVDLEYPGEGHFCRGERELTLGGTIGDVVTRVTKSNGIGGYNHWSYRYGDSGINSSRGKGFLGIGMRRVVDEQSGIATYTAYRLKHRHNGNVEYEVQYPSIYDGTQSPIYEVRNHYAHLSIHHQVGPNTKRTYLPYLSVSKKKNYENGEFIGGSIASTTTALSNGYPIRSTTTTTLLRGTDMLDVPMDQFDLSLATDDDVISVSENIVNYTNYCTSCIYHSGGSPWRIQFESEVIDRFYDGQPGASGTNMKEVRVENEPWLDTMVIEKTTRFPGDANLELITENTYSRWGNLTSTSLSGAGIKPRTTYYDGHYNNVPANIYDPLGYMTLNSGFDRRYGRPTITIDPNGLKVSTQYDAFERPIWSQGADGNITTVEYVDCSQETGLCAEAGNHAVYVKRTTPAVGTGPIVEEVFDQLNRTVFTRTEGFDDEQHVRVKTEYNAEGQKQRESLPYTDLSDRVFVSFVYDEQGRNIKKTRPDNSYTEWVYGNETDPVTGETYRRVISIDRVLREDNGSLQPHKFRGKIAYSNVGGQLVKSVDGIAADTRSGLLNIANLATLAPSGSASYQETVITSYTYDGQGNLVHTKVDGGSGRVTNTSLIYDAAGNRRELNDPDVGTVETRYSALGEMLWSEDNEGNVTTYDYDELKRLLTHTTRDEIFTYTYDRSGGIGQIASVSSDQGYREEYYYDDPLRAGRLSQSTESITVNGETLTTHGYITYDNFGRIDTQTYRSGITVRNEYNARGQLEQIVDADNPSDVLQRIESVGVFGVESTLYGNGIQTHQRFDRYGYLESLDHNQANGSTFFSQRYVWDTSGNLRQRGQSRTGGAISNYTFENFEYDDHDRLVRAHAAAPGANRELNYSYDNLGNILSKTGTHANDKDLTGYRYGQANAHCGAAGPHAVNRVDVNAQTMELCYDSNGFISEYHVPNGDNKYIEYNTIGQPIIITVGDSANDSTPTARDEFKYGPKGNRYYKRSTWQEEGATYSEETYYFSDGTELTYPRVHPDNDYMEIYKATISDNVMHISRVPYIGNAETEVEYLHFDHLGSIVAVTDSNIASGNPVQQNGFDPFGSRRSKDWLRPALQSEISLILNTPEKATNRGFTGHEHLDRTGFIHMNGRVYDPLLGRFLTPDPFVQAPTLSQSWNRYTYAWNNPMRHTDPSGYTNSKEQERQEAKASPAEKAQRNGDKVTYQKKFGNITVTVYKSGDIRVSHAEGNENLDTEDGKKEVRKALRKAGAGRGKNHIRRAVRKWRASQNSSNDSSAQKARNTRQDISNGLTGVGGVAQIAAGVAACSTGLGCVAGVPLIVLGVSNIGEAGTGFAAPDGKGFNLTGAAIELGFDALGTENSADLAIKTNAVVNLTADLVGLNVPSLAKNSFKLFRHIPTDYVRAVDNATASGLTLQAGTTVNTTVNALYTGSN